MSFLKNSPWNLKISYILRSSSLCMNEGKWKKAQEINFYWDLFSNSVQNNKISPDILDFMKDFIVIIMKPSHGRNIASTNTYSKKSYTHIWQWFSYLLDANNLSIFQKSKSKTKTIHETFFGPRKFNFPVYTQLTIARNTI